MGCEGHALMFKRLKHADRGMLFIWEVKPSAVKDNIESVHLGANEKCEI